MIPMLNGRPLTMTDLAVKATGIFANMPVGVAAKIIDMCGAYAAVAGFIGDYEPLLSKPTATAVA